MTNAHAKTSMTKTYAKAAAMATKSPQRATSSARSAMRNGRTKRKILWRTPMVMRGAIRIKIQWAADRRRIHQLVRLCLNQSPTTEKQTTHYETSINRRRMGFMFSPYAEGLKRPLLDRHEQGGRNPAQEGSSTRRRSGGAAHVPQSAIASRI